MTYTLLYKSFFVRRLQQLVGENRSLRLRVEKTLQTLAINPFHSGLHTHKVLDRHGGPSYAFRVTGDLRILWEFNGEQAHVLDILNIGGHEGSKKVYR